MESYGTIWVCQDCMLHHANGECGSCSDMYGPHDEEPLNKVDGNFHVAMGMWAQEHNEECEINITGSAPNDYECDCETDSYSTSQCQGCGSYLHGERHAMTLFKSAPRVVKAPELEDTPTLLRRLYLGR